jgi:hypothetical protein
MIKKGGQNTRVPLKRERDSPYCLPTPKTQEARRSDSRDRNKPEFMTLASPHSSRMMRSSALGNILDRQVGDLYEPCRRDDHTQIAQPMRLAHTRHRDQRRQRGEPSNPGERQDATRHQQGSLVGNQESRDAGQPQTRCDDHELLDAFASDHRRAAYIDVAHASRVVRTDARARDRLGK